MAQLNALTDEVSRLVEQVRALDAPPGELLADHRRAGAEHDASSTEGEEG